MDNYCRQNKDVLLRLDFYFPDICTSITSIYKIIINTLPHKVVLVRGIDWTRSFYNFRSQQKIFFVLDSDADIITTVA
jgi:hypothetical protein